MILPATQPLWLDGQMTLSFAVEPERSPVEEKFATNPRSLKAGHAFATLYYEDGAWTVGTVRLSGTWVRKTGQVGIRKGELTFTAPLTGREGEPDWLMSRIRNLLAALNTAMREAAEG